MTSPHTIAEQSVLTELFIKSSNQTVIIGVGKYARQREWEEGWEVWCWYCLYPQVWDCREVLVCPPPTPTLPSTQILSTPSCSPERLTGQPSWGGQKIFQAGNIWEIKLNIFRLVESQRMESLRQAEARASSFLSPFSKGKIFLFNLKRDLGLSPFLIAFISL